MKLFIVIFHLIILLFFSWFFGCCWLLRRQETNKIVHLSLFLFKNKNTNKNKLCIVCENIYIFVSYFFRSRVYYYKGYRIYINIWIHLRIVCITFCLRFFFVPLIFLCWNKNSCTDMNKFFYGNYWMRCIRMKMFINCWRVGEKGRGKIVLNNS